MDMGKQFYIYIMTNFHNTVRYTGFTSNLSKRVSQHKEKLVKGFTSKYNVNKLVHFEVFENAYDAIAREKQIKGGSRSKKVKLVESLNPDWKDLSDTL